MSKSTTIALSIAFLASCTTTSSINTKGDLAIDSDFVGKDIEYKVLVNDGCVSSSKKAKIQAVDEFYITTTDGDRIPQKEVCELQYQKLHLNPLWYLGQAILYAIGIPLALASLMHPF